jgi:hypothetical protein
MAKGRASISNRRPASWQLDWKMILERAKAIVESYETGVTLRQLFYRLVSEELIPNNQNVYKRLSSKTAAARREGWFPSLIDRTRSIEAHATWTSPESSLEEALSTYRRDRTEGQKHSIYLGVEKHGMSVQLMHWFGKYGIPVLALGGYSSQTFVDVVRDDIENQGRDAILLYAGDFDPSGVDIDRDFQERTEIFSKVIRVALNKKQVESYDLPPLPGKETDVRKWSFIAAHGELIQVELDALPPEELRKLYQKAIDRLWNKKAYEKVLEQEALERAVLRDALAVSGFDNPVSKSIFLLEDSESPVKVRPSKGQIGVLMDKVHDLDFGG